MDQTIHHLLRVLAPSSHFSRHNSCLVCISPEAHNLIGRSWLDKLLESKVAWFMTPIGWLPVPVPGPECSPTGQQQRINRSIIQSIRIFSENIYWLQHHSFSKWSKCRRPASNFETCLHLRSTAQHISLPFPFGASTPKGGRVVFFVRRSICLTHVTALIYAADGRARGKADAFLCAGVFERKDTNPFRVGITQTLNA